MTYDRFKELVQGTATDMDRLRKVDNAFEGLKILSKYTNELIAAAEHDIIYSEDIDVLLKRGITEEDAKELGRLNWSFNEDLGCISCFV